MVIPPQFHGLARSSLSAYAIAQDPTYQVARHHRILADALERVERGEIRRLVVSMPPRHGKSRLASQIFPAWFLGRNPRKFVIAASYNKDLATDMGQAVRDLMLRPMHGAVFPGGILRRDTTARSRFMTTEGGVYFGVGVGGGVTGKGAHLAILDDVVKSQAEADSELVRRRVKRWFASDVYTRLMAGGAVVMVMTRWHEDDLIGYALRELAAEGWHVINMPAIAEEDELDLEGQVLRHAGEALWPDPAIGFPLERLEAIRAVLSAEQGPRAWLALYQQRPVAVDGSLFKRPWFRTYQAHELPASFDETILSVDTSFKAGAGSDYAVFQVWGRKGAEFWLLDQARDRCGFEDSVAIIKRLKLSHPKIGAVLIELSANGHAIIESLKGQIPGVVGIKPDGGKVARASSITHLLAAGNVRFPAGAAWLHELLEELVSFPFGKHDDQVDALSQALRHLSSGEGILRALASLARK